MAKIAILGLGTVGGGVAEVLRRNGASISDKLGEPLELSKILVRHFRDNPWRSLMTDDFSQIEEDPEIRVVVETIGGMEAAYGYTQRALEAGKHVVTANKELVAEKGHELLELARRNHVSYLFEASVGGGIPILRPLVQCMAANEIEEVYGILNGTTNYILTRMDRSGASFAGALKEAQEKGYAEADPTADVEGLDTCRKICILADLAFGRQILPAQVLTEGISTLDLADVKLAEANGWRVKLLGRCLRLPQGQRTAYVAPHLVREDSPIASVEDVFNAIVVRGNATGEVMFYGKGAGDLPTASAVVADVIDALRHDKAPSPIGWSAGTEGVVSAEELKQRWYVRTEADQTAAEALLGPLEPLTDQTGLQAFLTQPLPLERLHRAETPLKMHSCLRVLT